jgi:hypothetical protein
MKIVSIFLTISLILPIGYQVFSVYEYQAMQSKLMFSHGDNFMTWEMLSYTLVDVFFMVVAVVLNLKQMYRENSIMCGTLLVAFVLSVVIHFTSTFLYNWLK